MQRKKTKKKSPYAIACTGAKASLHDFSLFLGFSCISFFQHGDNCCVSPLKNGASVCTFTGMFTSHFHFGSSWLFLYIFSKTDEKKNQKKKKSVAWSQLFACDTKKMWDVCVLTCSDSSRLVFSCNSTDVWFSLRNIKIRPGPCRLSATMRNH